MARFQFPIGFLLDAWSFILGLLRFVLFAGALIYLIVQICIAVAVVLSQRSLVSSCNLGTTYSDYIIASLLVFTAGLGVYGSFYKHINSMRLFAVLAAFLGVCFLLVPIIGSHMTHEFEDEADKLFSEALAEYDWHAKPNLWAFKKANETNKLVDAIQNLGCCGYKDYKDWNSYRPHGVYSSDLPISCCKFNSTQAGSQRCLDTNPEAIKRPGCHEHLKMIFFAARYVSIIYGIYHLYMAMVAFIVSYCGFVKADFKINKPNHANLHNNIINIEAGQQVNNSSVYEYSKLGPIRESQGLWEPETPPKYPQLV